MSWGAAIQQRNGMRITRIMGLLDVLGWKKSTSPALKGIKHDLGILSSMIQPTQPIPDHSTPGQSWGNCKNSREMGGSPNYGMFQVGRIPQGSSPALRESKVTLAFPNPQSTPGHPSTEHLPHTDTLCLLSTSSAPQEISMVFINPWQSPE